MAALLPTVLLLLLPTPAHAAALQQADLSMDLSPAGGAQSLSLGGRHWTVSTGNVSNCSATVPGQIHTDLLAAGLIDEPFFGAGDAVLEWVAMSDWDYSSTFVVPAAMLGKQHVQLVSLGIDTVADIFINGKHVFFTDNMFHRIRLGVKRFLQEGPNQIRVHFISKPREANRRAASCDNTTSVICPAGAKNPCQHPYDNVNYLRTEPCSFSWDWGPAFAPVGLWRPLYLQAYDSAVVRDITVITTPRAAEEEWKEQEGVLIPRWGRHYSSSSSSHPDAADAFGSDDQSEAAIIARAFRRTDRELDLTTWDIEAAVFLDAGFSDTRGVGEGGGGGSGGGTVAGQVVVSINTDPPVTASVSATVAAGAEVRVPISIKGVKADAWFPNGFGRQPLYILSAKFVPGALPTATSFDQQEAEEEAPAPFEVPYLLKDDVIKGADGSNSARFGFRQVQLVQKPLPGGKSFYFSVNGVPIPGEALGPLLFSHHLEATTSCFLLLEVQAPLTPPSFFSSPANSEGVELDSSRRV